MIPCQEALARVLAHARPLPSVRVALRRSLGRTLARDVAAREPVPRFDQSAMDGYGARAIDLQGATETKPVRLALGGELRPGDAARRALAPGTAIRIFTGAPVPRGVDAIVMQECCEKSGAAVLIRQAAPQGANIRRRGEEFQKGMRVLTAGTRVTPPVIGLLATLGCARPVVQRKPRVALIVTGNELRAPGERLKAGQIRDANSCALTAALEALGIEAVDAARVRDDREAIRSRLALALIQADVVLTVGGVSVGDYDFVKDAAAEVGVQTVYWTVAIKPGMPNYFGIYTMGKGRKVAERLVFGLPGNPVAALVSFHLFVRPALLKLAGALDPQPRCLTATLSAERRKKPGRLEWVRGVLASSAGQGLSVTPTGGQESHMLGGLAAADCLIEFPADRDTLERGEAVRVRLLEWEF